MFPFGPPMKSQTTERSTVLSVLLTLVMLGLLGCTAVLAKLVLSLVEENEDPVKQVLGLLTLVGTLLSLAVSLIGLMLKDSIDRRTLAFHKDSERQREREAKQAEDRLRMDTSLTAVELMGADDPKKGPALQRAGALMALANLGHEAFALGLLDEVWTAKSVPDSSAVWLVDKCLASENPDLQKKAAHLLRKHAEQLLTPDGRFLWPRMAFDHQGIKGLGAAAAFWSLEALLDCLTSRPIDEWSWEYLNEAYVLINDFQSHEDTRGTAARAMNRLMEYYLHKAPAESTSRILYQNSLDEANKIIERVETDDQDGGRMPILLSKVRDWLTIPAPGGRTADEDVETVIKFKNSVQTT